MKALLSLLVALPRRVVAKCRRMIFGEVDYVICCGSLLPHSSLRFNGPDQQNDELLLQSAVAEANRVTSKLGYGAGQTLVDIGCGQGRLAIGLIRSLGEAEYFGIDVSRESIEWCQRYIQRLHPSYKFEYLDVLNARYNPSGAPLDPMFSLPVATNSTDVVYMWGVVTNMEPHHLDPYAAEIARILRPGGELFLTANVEKSVPDVEINPQNYVSFALSGPLHIVRYELGYFTSVFSRAGLTLTEFGYHLAGNCQSDLYFVLD